MRYSTIFIFCLALLLRIPVLAQDSRLHEDLALKYVAHSPSVQQQKSPVVILMHGYGSNETDLYSLYKYFPENFIVVSVRAPYPLSNGGFQWFEPDRAAKKYTAMPRHLEHSRTLVLKFIPQIVNKYHGDASQVYVMGFSQGAIMSYTTGLTSPAVIKGIGVLSGILPDAIKSKIKQSPALSHLRIFVAHGTSDKVLPFADGKAASDYLMSIGLKPEFHAYTGMPHTINQQVVADLRHWIIQ